MDELETSSSFGLDIHATYVSSMLEGQDPMCLRSPPAVVIGGERGNVLLEGGKEVGKRKAQMSALFPSMELSSPDSPTGSSADACENVYIVHQPNNAEEPQTSCLPLAKSVGDEREKRRHVKEQEERLKGKQLSPLSPHCALSLSSGCVPPPPSPSVDLPYDPVVLSPSRSQPPHSGTIPHSPLTPLSGASETLRCSPLSTALARTPPQASPTSPVSPTSPTSPLALQPAMMQPTVSQAAKIVPRTPQKITPPRALCITVPAAENTNTTKNKSKKTDQVKASVSTPVLTSPSLLTSSPLSATSPLVMSHSALECDTVDSLSTEEEPMAMSRDVESGPLTGSKASLPIYEEEDWTANSKHQARLLVCLEVIRQLTHSFLSIPEKKRPSVPGAHLLRLAQMAAIGLLQLLRHDGLDIGSYAAFTPFLPLVPPVRYQDSVKQPWPLPDLPQPSHTSTPPSLLSSSPPPCQSFSTLQDISPPHLTSSPVKKPVPRTGQAAANINPNHTSSQDPNVMDATAPPSSPMHSEAPFPLMFFEKAQIWYLKHALESMVREREGAPQNEEGESESGGEETPEDYLSMVRHCALHWTNPLLCAEVITSISRTLSLLPTSSFLSPTLFFPSLELTLLLSRSTLTLELSLLHKCPAADTDEYAEWIESQTLPLLSEIMGMGQSASGLLSGEGTQEEGREMPGWGHISVLVDMFKGLLRCTSFAMGGLFCQMTKMSAQKQLAEYLQRDLKRFDKKSARSPLRDTLISLCSTALKAGIVACKLPFHRTQHASCIQFNLDLLDNHAWANQLHRLTHGCEDLVIWTILLLRYLGPVDYPLMEHERKAGSGKLKGQGLWKKIRGKAPLAGLFEGAQILSMLMGILYYAPGSHAGLAVNRLIEGITAGLVPCSWAKQTIVVPLIERYSLPALLLHSVPHVHPPDIPLCTFVTLPCYNQLAKEMQLAKKHSPFLRLDSVRTFMQHTPKSRLPTPRPPSRFTEILGVAPSFFGPVPPAAVATC
eukprot:gnl/Trimastix_PCT/4278.p1 GENE.gnl/Trimastix_PCT/4278~~gnl/Trimastix_PCT/4278.p1  ORF type:complete len:1152 (+),score=194.22 gnl/Trimastix_PCT/4278:453-3458(+)